MRSPTLVLLLPALLSAGEHSPGAGASSAVRLTPDTARAEAPGLLFHKIESPTATYYLETSGGGLAAMIDRDGRDWIGFRPDPGSRGTGEFRGFPNAVHQQAGNYFHPRNVNTDEMQTSVIRTAPGHVAIAVVSGNGLWAGDYDFFPTHCTFTMTKMPAGHRYWILYEGTPGGKLDDADWWMTSAVKEPQPIATIHEGDIPAPEWIAFGDADRKRLLFLLHHGDDDRPDRFYPMRRDMTVFGFGRHRGEKHFDSVPRSFSIGFLETTDHREISRAMANLMAKPQ